MGVSLKKYVFGHSKTVTPTYNTYIGGISASIGTASALATKLSISVGNISNFTVVGSDIKCKITGSYGIPNDCFKNNTSITYYRDLEYIVTSIGASSFEGTNIDGVLNFENATTIGSSAFASMPFIDEIYLKNATTIGTSAFINPESLKICYIPNCTNLGGSVGYDSVFYLCKSFLKVYANPSLATNNSGGVDGDLATVISNGGTIVYVTNFTAPNAITDLSAGTIYNTAIQLNFTPQSSTNTIAYYEIYKDGVYLKNITASGEYIIQLTASTSSVFTIKAVDIFLNKSLVSNSLNVTTTNVSNSYYPTNDVNALTYISTSGLSATDDINSTHHIFFQLKNNSLWTKIHAGYLFKGTAANNQKYNIKNPLDTNDASRLTFSGSGTFSSLGYQCNGTNSYANTNFLPSANQNVNSNGITLVVGTNNSIVPSDAWDIAAFVNGSQVCMLTSKNENTNYAVLAGLNTNTFARRNGVNDAKGVITGTKTSSTVHKLIKNGTVLATSTGGGTLPNIPIYIGALNYQNTGIGNYSSQRIQIVLFHEGLTDAEVTTLHSIIDISETIAGRKTW